LGKVGIKKRPLKKLEDRGVWGGLMARNKKTQASPREMYIIMKTNTGEKIGKRMLGGVKHRKPGGGKTKGRVERSTERKDMPA